MAQVQSEIVARAVACNLVSDKQVEQLREKLGTNIGGDALVENLVATGLLTNWQVKQLAAGKTGRFFVSHYKLLSPLGAGAMGQVFRAADANVARRQVAIKLLPKQAATPEAVSRFRREGATALQLQHEHVVRCFELGQHGETHFLVMELVDGATLKDYIARQGKVSVEETARIGYEVALALEHAWQRQIVHRDIKPANILLTSKNRVKLADLGLAKFFGPQGDTAQSLATRTGMLMGTLDYLAPEQAEDAKRADIRSDIYSLGCTLYQCLAGRPPFAEGTEVQRIMAHREQPVPPITEHNPAVEDLFADIIEKRMLAKRPEDRYQTPAEVAAALEPWTGGESRSFNVLDLLEQVVEKDAASGTLLAKPPAGDANWETYREHARHGETELGVRPVSGMRARLQRVGRSVGLTSQRDALIAAVAALVVVAILFGLWRSDRSAAARTETSDAKAASVESKTNGDSAKRDSLDPVADGRINPGVSSDEGWTELFNGKDLAGWQGDPAFWTVKNSVLTGRAAKLESSQYLLSEKDYTDFELRLQFKLTNDGNSGVQYRTIRNAEGLAVGHQAEIGFSGQRGKEGRSIVGDINGQGMTPALVTEAKRAYREAIDKIYRHGDWNDLVIRCDGAHEVVELNGVRTADHRDFAAPTSGKIGFQLWHRRPPEIEFRNIRIRELSAPTASKPIENTLAAPSPNSAGTKPAPAPIQPSSDPRRFLAVWVKNEPNIGWTANHDLDDAALQKRAAELAKDGLVPSCISGYVAPNSGRYLYAVVWMNKPKNVQVEWRHNLTQEEFRLQGDDLRRRRFRPVWFDVYGKGNEWRYAMIWLQDGTNVAWDVNVFDDPVGDSAAAETRRQAWDSQSKKHPPRVKSTFIDAGRVRHEAWLWSQEPGGTYWYGGYDFYQAKLDEYRNAGTQGPIYVDSYTEGSAVTYTLLTRGYTGGLEWATSAAADSAAYQKDFNSYAGKGYRLQVINVR